MVIMRVVQYGPHAQLILQDGPYRHMWGADSPAEAEAAPLAREMDEDS